MDDKLCIVNLAMEFLEMEVVLKQRQEVDCCARQVNVGYDTDVRSSTAQPRTGVGSIKMRMCSELRDQIRDDSSKGVY